MPRPLKVGVLLPDTESQMDGVTAGWADLATMTRTAEAVGFDSVWVTDHLIHRAEQPLDSPVEIGGDLRRAGRSVGMLVAALGDGSDYRSGRDRHAGDLQFVSQSGAAGQDDRYGRGDQRRTGDPGDGRGLE